MISSLRLGQWHRFSCSFSLTGNQSNRSISLLFFRNVAFFFARNLLREILNVGFLSHVHFDAFFSWDSNKQVFAIVFIV